MMAADSSRRFGLVGWLRLIGAFGPVLYAMVMGTR
jgi:hypothetical protein